MRFRPWLVLLLVTLAGACSKDSAEPVELRRYALDSMDGVITRSGTAIDTAVTSDGGGSLRITATEPVVVRLFETGDIDVEDARVVYGAKLRTRDVEGKVYLEMWCNFEGKGEFFTRALQSPLSGTQEWTSQETPFLLEEYENPDNFKLNVVIDGTGTVWVDDVYLVKTKRE